MRPILAYRHSRIIARATRRSKGPVGTRLAAGYNFRNPLPASYAESCGSNLVTADKLGVCI